MLPFNITQHTKNEYQIEGDMTFQSLNKKTLPACDFLNTTETLCIDLKKVNSADSAGLALLIEWLKYSQLYGSQIYFKNIPAQLKTLAKLTGFEKNIQFLECDQNISNNPSSPPQH